MRWVASSWPAVRRTGRSTSNQLSPTGAFAYPRPRYGQARHTYRWPNDSAPAGTRKLAAAGKRERNLRRVPPSTTHICRL